MYVTVFNPGQTPVVLDDRGRTLGGGEWGTSRTTDQLTSQGLISGALVEAQGGDGNDLSSGAAAAFELTAKYTERAAQIADLDKQALLKLARKNHLIGEDEDPLKAELERLLVESDADLTVKPTRKTAASGGKSESE